jgi:predicted transcriptional regulator
MTKTELLTRVAAIVSCVGEGIPESNLYIVCDMNMEDYSILREFLVNGELMKIKSHFATLTPKGIEMAEKLNKFYATKGL